MARSDDGLNPGDPGGVRWVVAGRVQGVGFRYHVFREARRLGVRGDVRNLSDGRVEIRVQGGAEQLRQLLASVSHGPRGARVDAVESSGLEPDVGFEDFTIR